MSLDAHVVNDNEYAILVLSGIAFEGCADLLKAALRESERHDHGHVIVDMRQFHGTNRETAKVLLWELGRAFDDDRTLRLVVRDAQQKAFLDSLGLVGMLPMHLTLTEAMAAVKEAIAVDPASARVRPTRRADEPDLQP